MRFELLAFACAAFVFVGMVILSDVGRRIGVRRRAQDPEGALAGVGTFEGAVFGLLGLLLAFTFSGAASRFDQRRQLIVEETNAIGTAYLRLDLLPPGAQPALRERFRQYVDARLAVYQKYPDLAAVRVELDRATKLQGDIWSEAVAAARDGAPSATMLLVPALNQMIDITTTRTMVARLHPPRVIFGMLLGVALVGALLGGYGMAGRKTRSWLHLFGLAGAVAIAVYVILDIEYPRLGLIRLDAFDQALVELRASMQ